MRFHGICLFLLPLVIGCGGDERSLTIKGSDTEVNLAVALVEAYDATHGGVHFSVSGGGSGLGIASMVNGLTDIANSSRPMNPEEQALFAEQGVQVIPIVVAYDALAIIVNEEMHLGPISVETLGAVFGGRITDWSAVGGGAGPITIYGRQNNSGTHAYLEEKLGTRFSPHARELNGNAQIIEAVASDRGGIGYVGAGYVLQDDRYTVSGVRILVICDGSGDCTSPADAGAVTRGDYYFKRPLYQYVRSSSLPKARALIDFERSPAGQAVIRRNGYYPVEADPS